MFALMIWMGRARMGAIRSGEARLSDIALGQRAWPARAQQISNAYDNQFQLPFLFLALAPLAIITHKDDFIFVILAWLFVLLRVAHAAVYSTTNHVPTRFRLFAAGALALALMWIIFAAQILFGF